MPGAETARRLDVSEPRVVAILREFWPSLLPKRSQEFEQRAFGPLPQVESLRGDASGENLGLTKIMLLNLAEEAGAHIALLPESFRQEMEEERWPMAVVRQQLLRNLRYLPWTDAGGAGNRLAQAPRTGPAVHQSVGGASQGVRPAAAQAIPLEASFPGLGPRAGKTGELLYCPGKWGLHHTGKISRWALELIWTWRLGLPNHPHISGISVK